MSEITEQRFSNIFPLYRKDSLCLESRVGDFLVDFQTGKNLPRIKGLVRFYKYNQKEMVNKIVFKTKDYKTLCNFLKENKLEYLLEQGE